MEEIEKKNIRTSILLQKLFKAKSLPRFLDENENSLQLPAFNRYLLELCQKRGTVPEQIIKRTTIERTYGHQLFNGTRQPSRDKVIQLAFGFELDLEEAQALLKAARKVPLYPKIKRDAVIMFCLKNHSGEIEVQEMLAELKLTMLGGLTNG